MAAMREIPQAAPTSPTRLRESTGSPQPVRYAVTNYDDYRHVFDGSGVYRTLCGMRGYQVAGSQHTIDPCPTCLPAEQHPLRPVWDLCDRLDASHAAATRPRPIDP